MYCSLRAARNTTLSRRPITTSRPISATSSVGLTRCRRRTRVTVGATSAATERGEDRQVEDDVADRAPVTAGERHLAPATVGGGWCRGEPSTRTPPVIGLKWPASGPHEPASPSVSSSTVHRIELLVDDRLGPPGGDVPERTEAGGGGGDEQAADDVEDEQLHDVDGVHHLRACRSRTRPSGWRGCGSARRAAARGRSRDRQAAGFRS